MGALKWPWLWQGGGVRGDVKATQEEEEGMAALLDALPILCWVSSLSIHHHAAQPCHTGTGRKT